MALEQEFLNYARDDGGNVSVPRRLRTRQNAPEVELAYVTPEEQGILAALRPGTPHRGPMEIPSYDAFDASGSYRGSEERDYGRHPSGQRATTAFTGASETGRGLAEAGMSRDAALNRMHGFQGPRRTGQGGQGFFGGLRQGLGNITSRLGDWARNLRMVDGQLMPQDYWSDENRYNRQMKAFREKYGKKPVDASGLFDERQTDVTQDMIYPKQRPEGLTDFNQMFNVDDTRALIKNAPGMNVTSLDEVPRNLVAGNYSQNAVTGQMFGQGMLYDNLTPFHQGQIDDAINTYGTTSLGTIKSKDGGYMRPRYSNGGRVGILAAF